MGGKGKRKKGKGKGKGSSASGRGGPTPGAASWRWGAGGSGGGSGGDGRKYGQMSEEAVEAQMAALAEQMGLEAGLDASARASGGGARSEAKRVAAAVSNDDDIGNSDDGVGVGVGGDSAGGGDVDAPARDRKKARKQPPGATASLPRGEREPSVGAQGDVAARLGRPEALARLLLRAGDVQPAAGRAPKSPAQMWEQLARCVRLVRATRLAVGHPPRVPDTPAALALLAILGAWLRPLLAPGACRGALEDLLNARTCGAALLQAGTSAEQLGGALEEEAAPQGEGHGGSLPEGGAAAWVRLVCSLDELYFQLHYAARVAAPPGAEVLLPADYLEQVAPPGGLAAVLERLDGDSPAPGSVGLRALVGAGGLAEARLGGGCRAGTNALLRIYWARLAEGAALFLGSGLAATLAARAPGDAWYSGGNPEGGGSSNKKKKKKRGRGGHTGEPPSPPPPSAPATPACVPHVPGYGSERLTRRACCIV